MHLSLRICPETYIELCRLRFASCAPAPFTLNDTIEERDDRGSGFTWVGWHQCCSLHRGLARPGLVERIFGEDRVLPPSPWSTGGRRMGQSPPCFASDVSLPR